MMLSQGSPPPAPRSKFSVSQHAAIFPTSSVRHARPSLSSFVVILFVASVSFATMIISISRERRFVKYATETGLPRNISFFLVRVLQTTSAVVLLLSLSALCKALSFQSRKNAVRKKHTEQKLDVGRLDAFERSHARHRLPRSRTSASPAATSQSSLLVPVHQTTTVKAPNTSSMLSPSLATISQGQTSPANARVSPWKKTSSPHLKEDISSEDKLQEFLADVEDKMLESTVKTPPNLLTPPPTIRGVGTIATPSTGPTVSSTTKSTPIRPMRISPSPQKFGPSPRKGEGELPPPMSVEQATEGFQKLGVYPQIEQWRDQIRQWFSTDLLNPLVSKLDASHLQVMQAASKLGLSINVSPVGGSASDGAGVLQPMDAPAQEWVSTFSPDEDALLHQLRAHLVQARDLQPIPQSSTFGLQQPQVRLVNPAIQECLDAVSEHQRLKALMRGEWAKGLLPQSSVRADYTVRRIRELAEGTCVKKYEYLATGELYDKIAKKWTLELPTDSHLLIYLFCALLEHPNWMLHIDAATQPSIQSNNPLFVAILPTKERCPDKYVAVLSSAPSFLHNGACVLLVGKQNPPVFALYWDKRLQFSMQGRTALWDATLLLCHRIKTSHGGVVQGINLGSSAFNLLTVFETPEEDDPEDQMM